MEYIKYFIFLKAVEGQKLIRELHQAHSDHLKKLDEEGILVIAGPFKDHPSGVIVINADSFHEARKIAEADPFIIHGYRMYEIRALEWCCKENNYMKPL